MPKIVKPNALGQAKTKRLVVADRLSALIAADEASLSGVYCIVNKVDGKRYVGSSAKKIINRVRDHKKQLRNNVHCNRHLQSAWNKYGEQEFKFIVLRRCTPDRCIELEQEYMDSFESWNPRYGYNQSKSASNTWGNAYVKRNKGENCSFQKR